MNRNRQTALLAGKSGRLLAGMLLTALLATHLNARPRNALNDGRAMPAPLTAIHSNSLDTDDSDKDLWAIPVGTILPVRLNTTISSKKNKPGQVISGRIMQDVPLGPGKKIPAGSKVTGRIVEVIPASTGLGAKVTVQFDKLIASATHQEFSLSTSLRAIAGFMSVLEAQTPPIGPGETDVYDWLTTVQIGGDVVYGKGGIVTAADHPDQIVGKEVYGGVLGKVTAKEGAGCRGAINGNDQPQALWVFSFNACGTYGMEHTTIAHAGRTAPLGVIVMASDHDALKIAAGAGMLLRVNDAGKAREPR